MLPSNDDLKTQTKMCINTTKDIFSYAISCYVLDISSLTTLVGGEGSVAAASI